MSLPIHLTAASDRIAREWESERLSTILRVLVLECVLFALEVGWWPVCLTCLIRTSEEDQELGGSGLHPARRAADIRTYNVAPEKVQVVADRLNARWCYDPNRPELLVAVTKTHGTGPHLHLQVHMFTELRGKSS